MKTLVLNTDMTPLGTISYKRAVVLSIKNENITVLSFYKKQIRSETRQHKIPAVILYQKYVSYSKPIKISKKHILYRDKYKCQYCSVDLNNTNGTVDHIIPICRFKNRTEANTWENMVAACKKCNLAKGDKSLEQFGKKLLSKPKKLTHILKTSTIPDEWAEYLLDGYKHN